MSTLTTMLKRTRSFTTASPSPAKRSKLPSGSDLPLRIATVENAAAADENTPLSELLRVAQGEPENVEKGDCVVYWMRMGDLRISDNRALAQASTQSEKEGIPLVALFIISPQDYVAHYRSPRRIDFVLRNLAVIKTSLAALHVPLHTTTHPTRRTLPDYLLSLLRKLNAAHLFANIEYEVDELRRDISVCRLAKKSGVKPVFVHDRCIIEPGVVQSKEQKVYTVYSPYQRNWLSKLNGNLSYYLEECPTPKPNFESIRDSETYGPLFDMPVPDVVDGFELTEENKQLMEKLWPAGTDAAVKIMDRFMHTKSRTSQLGAADPLEPMAESSKTKSRIMNYKDGRDRIDCDSTSRLSPYLSAGVISARACVRATMALRNITHVEGGKDTSVGRWVQEVAWRDFYTCILAGFPRVSMGQPFLDKYAKIKWEDESTEDALACWEEGRTGVPIVDAAMRCLGETGWMHNRLRMITAMFLCKDLMIDWRLGERFFMRQLIDGDLASNNGGWQWSASTGTDACPYFRIFNPYSQSEKADPSGEFIRRYVPELAMLRGSAIHNPSAAAADKIGYPRPIIKHDEARKRAIRRFKNPGQL